MATGMERAATNRMRHRSRMANSLPADPTPSGSLAAFNNKTQSSYGAYGGKAQELPRIGEQTSFKGTNLNKFISEINSRGGLYKPNLYFVMINKPPGLNSKEGVLETVMYMCNSAALPGVQMLTSDYKRQGFGTFDRRPFGVQITDIPLTFFVDNQGNLMNFFHEWMDNIVHYHEGGSSAGEHAVKGGYQKFEVGYRTDYITSIEIYCFNQNSDAIMKYTLYEAFPIQMGDITIAWAETDSFSILPVQFTFRTYDYERLSPHPLPDDPVKGETWKTGDVAGASGPQPTSRSMNIVGALSNIAGTIGLIQNAINTPLSVGSAINLVNNTKLVSGQLSNII